MHKFLPFLPPLLPLLAAPFAAQEQAQLEQAPPAHAFLWKVEHAGSAVSYLLGTVHVPDERANALHPQVRAALGSADALYCELDFADLSQLSAELLEAAELADGTLLEDVVPEELWERLDARLARTGLRAQILNRFKPFMVELTLAQLEMAPLLASGKKALDERIYLEAKANGKEVGGVELVAEQIDVLANTLTIEESVVQLGKALDNMDEADARGMSDLEQTVRAWLSGSEKLLEAVAFANFEFDDPLDRRLYEALVTRRNLHMAERAAQRMRAHPEKSHVFAFGTLHFVGTGSVVELLRADGFQVTRQAAPNASEEAALLRDATWLKPKKELEPAGAGR